MFVNIASKTSQSALSTFTEDQVQPNAIDLRLDRVWEFSPSILHAAPFYISETEKRHSEKVEVLPNAEGEFYFDPGQSYEVQFQGIIAMGPNETGWVITRSTLNRNGLFLTSGLYDSGYSGAMAGMLHCNNPNGAIIKHGTRVGQFICASAEALHSYDGSYGIAKDGSVKEDEKRYHG